MQPTTNDSAETEMLLEQVAAGDRGAFEELFAKHRSFLHSVVKMHWDHRLRKGLDPSDVVQEVHAEAYRRMSDFLVRRPMSFRLWLRKTTQKRLTRLHQQHVQAERRSVQREVPLPDRSSVSLAKQLLSGDIGPRRWAIQQDLTGFVRQAMSQLADTDREALLKRYVEKLSNRGIGHALNRTPDAVSKRHGRALIKLQQLLGEYGVGGSH